MATIPVDVSISAYALSSTSWFQKLFLTKLCTDVNSPANIRIISPYEFPDQGVYRRRLSRAVCAIH